MKLTAENLTRLGESAIRAARQAGGIIQAADASSFQVKSKPGGDSLASQVVTEVDLQVETAIVTALGDTLQQYDLGLLTEERGDDGSRLEKDYFWCIDPMDGTLSFIEDVPGYAVSIALVSKTGEAVIGVVYDPVCKTLYSAVSGQGAKRNGRPWQLTTLPVTEDRPLTLVCDRSLEEKPYYSSLVEYVTKVAHHMGASGLRTLHKGGAVMNACRVLENVPACYFKRPKSQKGGGSIWDFAATTCLFHETGAFSSDFNGQPLKLNRTDTTFMHADGVMFSSAPEMVEAIKKFQFN